MKRTIDNFFVKNIKLRSDSSEGDSKCSDTEPSSSQVGSSHSPQMASVNEPDTIDLMEPQPTEIKRAKVYTFQKGWLDQFPWLRHSKADNMMHCIYCKECGKTMAGNSAFVSGANTFRIETLKKHNASIKHTACRDKCTAQVSPLPAAFQRQAAANRSSEEAEMIIKFNIAYNIASSSPKSFFKRKID